MQAALWLVLIALAPLTSQRVSDKLGDLNILRDPRRDSSVPLPRTFFLRIVSTELCSERSACPREAAYRTINGVCNNPLFTEWGQAGTASIRLAAGNYQDGDHEPRKAKSGRELPNAREIVVKLFSTVDKKDDDHTLAVMSVGQLLVHDTSHLEVPETDLSSCCTRRNSSCMNIAVSPNDPFYGQFNVTCLPLIRAGATGSTGCLVKPQSMFNQATSFVDASFLYGTSDEEAADLRAMSGGKLKQKRIKGHFYPPQNPDSNVCSHKGPGGYCMKTGDTRANQNIPLSALHIIFLREHNRLADELAKINPDWDDERLYQEARRILIAEWQIIVYRDYLPIIIGEAAAKSAKLMPDLENMSGHFYKYRHPGTTLDFSGSAMRIFHNQIPDTFCPKSGAGRARGCPFGAGKFSDYYNDPTILDTKEGLQSVLAGLYTQNAAAVDDEYSVEVSGKLFPQDGQPYGADLVSIDIQRSRDIGLATFNSYRNLCGLRTAHTWEELAETGDFDPKDVENLRSLYESPEDMDVYVAGILEKKSGRAYVGPTFECLIVDQFKRWKEGDRFFVDIKGNAFSFTPEQAAALASTSMARIFCDNGDGIREIRRNIFSLRSEQVSCNVIPRVDLTPWKNKPTPADTQSLFITGLQKLIALLTSPVNNDRQE